MVAAPGGARWPPLIKALTIIFVGCVLGTIVVGAAIWRAIRPMVSAPERLSIVLPTDHPVAFGWVPGRSLAISPDGTQIAYVSTILELPSDTSGNRRLLLRSLGDRSVRDLPGTAGAVQPFFSSDNKWIGFFTHTGDLKKISLAGGNPVTLLEKINGAFWAVGVWAGDNTIIFGTRQKGLERISADGGRSQNVTTIDAGQNETSHTTPTLVGSRAVLFSVIFNNRLQDPRIDAVTLDTGERRVVVENGRDPHYLASGHLLFQRGETLLVAPFDAKGLTLTGPAVPFVDEIRRDGADGTGQVPQLVVSDNGTVAYVPGVETTSALVQVSRSGASAVIGPAPDRFDFPRISPNGQYVAFQIQQGRRTIVHVYDVVRGTTTRLTQDGTDFSPSWHPNSRQLAVTSGKTDISGIFLKDLNGTERLLVPNPGTTTFVRNSSWSPDGRVLAYTVQTGSLHDIWVVTADDKSSAQPLLNGPATEHTPAFSPDGRWLAYVSDQSGRAEVYVRRYPQGDTLSVSSGGGQGPVWGRDGREIFFQGSYEGNAKLMVVSVDMTGNTLRLGRPTPLLDMRVPGSTGAIEQYAGSNNQGPGYDIFPDGKRFVMIRRADPRGTREIVLIQNFFEELKRLVPTK
jgi:Tol biopolymer transport system component